jgi:hypothetical protein
VGDMDEHASTRSRNDIHTVLSEPIYNKLVVVRWSCYTTCFQPSGLSTKLQCRWSLHIKLYCLLSEVSTWEMEREHSLTRFSGYSFAQPTSTAFTDRPAFGGTCYTPLWLSTGAVTIIATMYGNASVTETAPYTATATNAQAFAFPIDGYAFGVAEVASLTTSTSSGTSSSSTSSSATTAATHIVSKERWISTSNI